MWWPLGWSGISLMPKSLILLVDGLAVAYRAYHAIPVLTAPDGEPTNALFGFIKMLRQLDEQWHPTHRAVIFDGGLPAARMEAWPDYKAQRPPMPEDLKIQLQTMERFLDLAGWTHVRPPDEEADDALATLATSAHQQGAQVLIASSDKDLLQLVNEGVKVIPPTKDAVPLGPDEVRAKMGVWPGQIVDVLALMGDSADNIPGVPGIGPKTAAQLLNTYTSLASIWSELDAVEPVRVRELLRMHRATVLRNVELMRLRTDLPALPDLEQLTARRPDIPALIAFLDGRGLQSIARLYRDTELTLF